MPISKNKWTEGFHAGGTKGWIRRRWTIRDDIQEMFEASKTDTVQQILRGEGQWHGYTREPDRYENERQKPGRLVKRRRRTGYIERDGEQTLYQEFKEVKRMGLHNLVANGGKVVVIGGRMNASWERYQDDPRVEFWTGDRQEIERHFSSDTKGGTENLPTNTHGVIISRFISHTTLSIITAEARKKQLTIFGPKNDGEVTRLLHEILTEPKMDKPKEEPTNGSSGQLRPPKRGELVKYAKAYDDSARTIKQSSDYIWALLRKAGVAAASLSVQQTVGNMRRQAGVFANPKISKTMQAKKRGVVETVMHQATEEKKVPESPPPSKSTQPPAPVASGADDGTLALMKMIDDLMASMELMKEAVTKMHTQNQEYRQLEAKLKELGFIKK